MIKITTKSEKDQHNLENNLIFAIAKQLLYISEIVYKTNNQIIYAKAITVRI